MNLRRKISGSFLAALLLRCFTEWWGVLFRDAAVRNCAITRR